MLAFNIDTLDKTAGVVSTDGSLKDMYRFCHCDCIDITHVGIDGRRYAVIVDDMGFLRDSPVPSVFRANGDPMLAGSIMIMRDGVGGELVGIDEDDVDLIIGHLKGVVFSGGEHGVVLMVD